MVSSVKWLAVAVAILAVTCPALAAQEYGISKGMGAVAWEQDVSAAPGFMKLKTHDGVDYFVNLRETYALKGYDKPTVFYGAVKGRLYAVHIRLEGAGFDKLKADIASSYGPGKVKGADVVWKTPQVRLKLKQETGQDVKLSVYYRPMETRLAFGLRDADPVSMGELARLLPAGDSPQKPVVAQGGQADKPQEGIDLGKVLGLGKKR